jgi:hypothetical protein
MSGTLLHYNDLEVFGSVDQLAQQRRFDTSVLASSGGPTNDVV